MLGNILQFCQRAVKPCLRLNLRHAQSHLLSVNQGVPSLKMSCSIHTALSGQFSMDKETRNKNSILKRAWSEKMESLEPMAVDVSGLSEAGVTIPTLETHASLIDGVRYDELPIVHIKSSPNNTIMLVTDHTGTKHLARNSCGREGFRNVKKSTTIAAQATGYTLGLETLKKGIRSVRVLVKGLGAGRLPSIKGMQLAGVKIISITDRTITPHGGPRPRKAKRL